MKRPAFLLGLLISILSVCGIILATGNLISLQHTSDRLSTSIREQYRQRLSQAGIPD
jgi:hypothetical protein